MIWIMRKIKGEEDNWDDGGWEMRWISCLVINLEEIPKNKPNYHEMKRESDQMMILIW